MILNNVRLIDSDEPVHILIEDEKVGAVSGGIPTSSPDHVRIDFENALAFPGLINSHDHLDFNLYPQLGYNTYDNYTEWGAHIHRRYKDEIAAVSNIPSALRYRWGLYKNLLCGVTTVVNHGERSGLDNGLITVFEEYHCLHSVGFEKNWRRKLNHPFKTKKPVVIHTGEGTDPASRREIDQLLRWNLLGKTLIGVHGVAMTPAQAKKFKALVWCPQSNYFLLDKTAPVDLLKEETTILFGTDSTLTSAWNIWDHIRLARTTAMLSDDELYRSLNKTAADAWRLTSGEIAGSKDADLVIAKIKPGGNKMDAFYRLNPADLLMVIHRGHIRLFDASLEHQLPEELKIGFSVIHIDGAVKYVQGDLPGLLKEVMSFHPQADFPVSVLELVHQTTG